MLDITISMAVDCSINFDACMIIARNHGVI